MKWTFDLMSTDSITVNILAAKADSIIGSNHLKSLCDANPDILNTFDLKFSEMDKIITTDSYRQHLSLPGKVYSSNAEDDGTSGLTWSFDSDSFFMKDYEMEASSRVSNRGIMILTAILAIFLMILLFAGKKKQKNTMPESGDKFS
jgi:hypothetical protein